MPLTRIKSLRSYTARQAPALGKRKSEAVIKTEKVVKKWAGKKAEVQTKEKTGGMNTKITSQASSASETCSIQEIQQAILPSRPFPRGPLVNPAPLVNPVPLANPVPLQPLQQAQPLADPPPPPSAKASAKSPTSSQEPLPDPISATEPKHVEARLVPDQPKLLIQLPSSPPEHPLQASSGMPGAPPSPLALPNTLENYSLPSPKPIVQPTITDDPPLQDAPPGILIAPAIPTIAPLTPPGLGVTDYFKTLAAKLGISF